MSGSTPLLPLPCQPTPNPYPCPLPSSPCAGPGAYRWAEYSLLHTMSNFILNWAHPPTDEDKRHCLQLQVGPAWCELEQSFKQRPENL